MGHWITAVAGSQLVRAVAAAGGDAEAMRARLGVTDATMFADRLPLDELIAAWEDAVAATGRRDLPVLACTRSTHDERSLVGFFAASSDRARR